MSALDQAYAAPSNEEDESEEYGTDEGESTMPPAVWFAIPVWRLWLFSLLGGPVYQAYWQYRCWQAFRLSMGYSRYERWRARYEANGFRVSPFWRGALLIYSYCWLLVLQRELRLHKVAGFGSAWPWFALQVLAISALPLGWSSGVLSLVFLPAQLAVNRLHDALGEDRARAPVTAAELCWLAVGLFMLLQGAVAHGGWS